MSCSRGSAYRNGKTFEECRDIAKKQNPEFRARILKDGRLGWDEIMESVGGDELLYKLALKYLRQDGFDIGDYRRPEVRIS